MFGPAVLVAAAILVGCAAIPGDPAVSDGESESEDAGETQASAQEPEIRSPLPKLELTESVLYEYLLAEIASQRGSMGLSAQAYVDLARRTRDPRIARRATEIALYARMNGAAIDAARIWYESDPESERPLQALAGLLVAGGSYSEALPYLRKLLAGSSAGAESGFTQLTRSLAGAQDKRAALALVQELATGCD